MSRFATHLWFDTQAEDAARFYVSLFDDAELGSVIRRTGAEPGPNDGVLTAAFRLGQQRYVGINGGPHYKLTAAVSIMTTCETQAEIDRLWTALGAGGTYQRCGWLTDRFGLSWQIVPEGLDRLIANPETGGRVMRALLDMVKLDKQALEAAARGA